jgi:hypothetical protein
MEEKRGQGVKRWLNRDVLSSVFWMGVGVVFVVGSFQYRVIKSGTSGPGFVPFLAGVILVILSASLFLSAVRAGSAAMTLDGFFPHSYSLRRFLVALLALPLYVVGMMYLGCFLVSLLFLLFFMKFAEPRSWGIVLAIALLGAATIYVVFSVLLKIPFPTGPFGF